MDFFTLCSQFDNAAHFLKIAFLNGGSTTRSKLNCDKAHIMDAKVPSSK